MPNPVRDLPVKIAEHFSGAGEVKSRELGVLQNSISDTLRVTRKELDDVRRQASFLQNLHLKISRIDGIIGGLPDNDVAHNSWGSNQVGTDSGEVEGADSIDKALQRAIFQAAGSN
jgi:hypothetical protein